MKREKRSKQNGTLKKADTPAASGHSRDGIVKAVLNKQVQVLADGESFTCMIPGSLAVKKNDLCVGDYVKIDEVGNHQYKLLQILPRETAVYRGNRRFRGEDVMIAANVQYLIAVVTAEYLQNQAGYLEAAMIAARRAEIEVGIFISKWDRIGEQAQDLLQEKIAIYKNLAAFAAAGTAEEWRDHIAAAVKGKTVLVIGDRGCGKTTFIGQFLCTQTQPAAAGMAPASTHTSSLEAGMDGTFWIDTPGFRDFSLSGISEEERNQAFPEIAEHARHCYFSNCTHVHEEGCQVILAVKNRTILRERYDACQSMYHSATEPLSRREPRIDYRKTACMESFSCKVCKTMVAPDGAGSRHRNHCPNCLSSIHVDIEPGDRKSLCHGIMEPIGVWVRKNGEWAIIHRCKDCETLSSNRIAADDNPTLLMSIAVKPLAMPPFPLGMMEGTVKSTCKIEENR